MDLKQKAAGKETLEKLEGRIKKGKGRKKHVTD